MSVSTQPIDKLAITLSSLCIAHCLVFPFIALVIPNVVSLGLNSEAFHFWMIVAVIPSSTYALTLGCKKHNKLSLVLFGGLGLVCLLLAFALGGNILTELGEKGLTLIGALLIIFAHIKNFTLCKQVKNGECTCDQRTHAA